MATIILNETPFTVFGFNRNTTFNDDSITSYAYFNIAYNNSADLFTLAENPITSLVIKNSNNEAIYTLSNINAVISNIDEILSNEDMVVNVNLQFTN